MLRSGALVVLLAFSVGGCARIKAHFRKPPPATPAAATTSPSPVAIPDGYARVHVGGVTRLPHGGDAVLLVEDGKLLAVPIFIAGTEALSIQLRLKKQSFDRPLTHDLLDASIQKLGGKVESVRVDKLEKSVFYGTVVLSRDGKLIELDARPSDAIAIAIGSGVPIHVSRKVLAHAGLDLSQADVDVPSPSGERPPPVTL
ncbi:MAG: bifunctional nuclease family protein [Myxococcales bacterium]|nr:bifunctional nuclease family protein [Myxococcales bacterium]